MLFGRSPKMVTPAEALPGRSGAMPVPEAHFVNGASLTPPWPDAHAHRGVRAGLLLGRRAGLLAASRRDLHRGGLHGRLHREPHLPGGLLGPHRTHRGRPGGLRPRPDQLRPAAGRVLGGPRPDPGLPTGQRRRHPVPLGHLHHRRRAAGRCARQPRPVPEGADRRRASARSPATSSRCATSSTPRSTTSSTWPRTRVATAAWAAPGSPARSASRPSTTEPHRASRRADQGAPRDPPLHCGTWLTDRPQGIGHPSRR